MSLKKKQIIALCVCGLLLAIAIFQNLKKDTNVSNGDQNNNPAIVDNNSSDEFFAGARIERESSRSSAEDECLAVIADETADQSAKTTATEREQSLAMMTELEGKMEVAVKSRGYDDVFILMEDDGNIDATVKAETIDEVEVMAIANVIIDNTQATLDNIVVRCIK